MLTRQNSLPEACEAKIATISQCLALAASKNVAVDHYLRFLLGLERGAARVTVFCGVWLSAGFAGGGGGGFW